MPPIASVETEVPDGLVFGPAGPMVGTHFYPFSAPSLDAYVQALKALGFRCFGLPTNVAPWLPPVQQQRLAGLLRASGLRGWHTSPTSHALDYIDFTRNRPLWPAALAYHAERIQVATDSGLEGAILGTPPDAAATLQEMEAHFRSLVERHPGRVWIANTANPAKRTGTAQDLAGLCRATAARPCYNAPAHALRVGHPVTVDEHKQVLRELGRGVVVLYGNLVVRSGKRAWELYEGELDAGMAAPLRELVLALRELKRLDTPVLVQGAACEYDVRKALGKTRLVLGLAGTPAA